MRFKVIKGIALTVLLVGMLILVFKIQTIQAEPTTWTVDDDGPADFSSIQEAINAASPGDTIYVYNGTYYEHVVVNKSVSLVGENKCNTVIDGNYTGIVMNVTANNVKITGFTIQKSGPHTVFGEEGIFIYQSSGNNISYNILADNRDGIQITESSSNIIFGNKIINNIDTGICLSSNSSSNFLSKNNITNSGYGVWLEYDCRYNNIFGNNINNCWDGIVLEDSSNYNTIFGNNVSANYHYGISIYFSSNNSIYENNITNNDRGMLLLGTSIDLCRNNVIFRNNVMANNYSGIQISHSSYNSIFGNKIANNNESGIYLGYYSPYNRISGNNITNNKYGIYLEYSSNNTIYHNNFVNNSEQAYIDSSTNTWDYGYPSGGNYWSNYAGVDLYSGPYQNKTGSDGIGDTPYILDTNNTDRYPLMNPWNPIESSVSVAGEDYPVTVVSNITISQIDATENILYFKSSGPPGEKGCITVIFPMVNTTAIEVFIDGNELTPPPFPVINTNGTHYFIYFEFTLSTHNIAIQFAWVAGDLNDDGHVNLSDLSLFADHWYGHDPASGKTYNPQADINNDGLIDLSDLSILADNWYKGPKDVY